MNDKLVKGLTLTGLGLGIVSGALSIAQTVDQMVHGIKLRPDQQAAIATTIQRENIKMLACLGIDEETLKKVYVDDKETK